MRIVVDLQALQNGSRHRGIGRYCEAFFKALMRNGPQHEYVLLHSGLMESFVESSAQAFKREFPSVTVKVWDGLGPASFMNVENDWRRKASEILREEFIESLRPDLLIVGSIFEGCGDDSVISVPPRSRRSYVAAAILYDLIPYIYKQEYLADPVVLAWYEARLHALRACDFWLAISESSRLEAIEILGFPECQVVNVSAAVGPEFRPIEYVAADVGRHNGKFQISRPFALYSGATDPRKNVERLIAAFAGLDRSVRAAHQLVIAGGMPEDHKVRLRRIAEEAGLAESDLVITDRISDDELVYLYNTCRCFIFPSYHEGFGLPALEAMSCGAPTVGAGVSSIPEVIGLVEAMFDPFSVDAIRSHLERALLDDAFRKELQANASERARRFSWDNSAQRALKFIHSVMADAPPCRADTDRPSAVERVAALGAINHSKEDLAVASAFLARLIPREGSGACVFVDVSELARRDLSTGIQRVVRNIAGILAAMRIPGYCIRFVRATEDDGYRYVDAMFASEPGLACHDGRRIDPREGDVFIGLDYHDRIVTSNAKYFDFMRRRGISVQFVLYDILPLSLSKYFSLEVRENFEAWLRVVGRADRVICISRAVAREYAEWRSQFDVDAAAEVSWFHLGADVRAAVGPGITPHDQTDITRITERHRSFLMVGTLEPRKGYRDVLDAFDVHWQRGGAAALIIVGRAGWMMDDFIAQLRAHPESGKRLLWIENASDDVLLDLYRRATCLIAASEGEGFGLPIIEAARHGLHVLARNLDVFQEVAGEGAAYFSSSQPAALADAIDQWLETYLQGRAPDPADVPWITWKQSAETLLERLALNVGASAHQEQVNVF